MKKLNIGQLIERKYTGKITLTPEMLLEMLDEAIEENRTATERKEITEGKERQIVIDLEELRRMVRTEQ